MFILVWEYLRLIVLVQAGLVSVICRYLLLVDHCEGSATSAIKLIMRVIMTYERLTSASHVAMALYLLYFLGGRFPSPISRFLGRLKSSRLLLILITALIQLALALIFPEDFGSSANSISN